MVGAVVSGSSGRNIEVVSITKWVYHRKNEPFTVISHAHVLLLL